MDVEWIVAVRDDKVGFWLARITKVQMINDERKLDLLYYDEKEISGKKGFIYFSTF